MTYEQQHLMTEAKDMWQRGFGIPIWLASALAATGLDPEQLEIIYRKEQ